MHFTTYEFIAFFAFILIFNNLGGLLHNIFRKFVLIGASYFLYATFSPYYVITLASISLVTLFFAKLIKAKFISLDRLFLAIGVVLVLSVLIFLKYYDFFVTSMSGYVPEVFGRFEIIDIVTPIGLSYMTFKAISLLVDCRRGRIENLKSVDVLLYLSFFPQILAGPIERYSDFVKHLSIDALIKTDFAKYALRFCVGVAKKLLLVSALLSNDLMSIFQLPSNYSGVDLLIAIYLFSAYVFIDFSGYSDISIGLSGMLGIRTMENFDKPYFAASLTDFWRRWHISLSSWIRDYIYIPLGGNRKGKLREIVNLVFAMTIAGIWHGVNLNFLIWGFIHGILLAMNRVIRVNSKFRYLGIFVTFHLVSLLWIFFNTESLGTALEYLTGLASFDKPFVFITLTNLALIVLVFVIHNYEVVLISKLANILKKFRFIYQGIILGIILWLIFELAPETTPYFIYYQF